MERTGFDHFNVAGLLLALRADLNYNKFTFKNDLAFSPGGGSGGTITTTEDLTQQIIGGLAEVTSVRSCDVRLRFLEIQPDVKRPALASRERRLCSA